jgi:hypothetical protein
MPAVDLFSKPGQSGIDLVKERALLVAWLLINSNTAWVDPATVLVKTPDDLAKVLSDAEETGNTINYLDMQKIYPALPQVAPADIDDLITQAQQDDTYYSTAKKFWSMGQALCQYNDDYCLAMADVLALNAS